MGQPADYTRYTPANENRATLMEEIRELQAQLANLAQVAGIAASDVSPIRPTSMELDVRRVLNLRASRATIFDKGLFGEPAWDMLLDLYAADLSGRPESVASVCFASGVAPSTALRWLQHLQREGWIQGLPDSQDRQRFFLALSDKSRTAMKHFFAHAQI